MDRHQPNRSDDVSTLTSTQPVNVISLTSVATSTLDSASKTTSQIDRRITRIRSSRKRHDQQQLVSGSTATTSSLLTTTIEITDRNKRREARPLGTCVRKCSQCEQLKHILLAECTVCFRMMDIDLKDCKCQMFRRATIIDHFICSICNSELTLEGYIICANRTCQTTLSALVDQEDTNESRGNSFVTVSLTNISYPKSTYRTVAAQVNTLANISPLLQFPSVNIDDKNDESSLLSSSKRHLDWLRMTSSDSSSVSRMSIDSGVDASLNNIAKKMIVAFNSNQPSKLALQSEDDSSHQQIQSPIHQFTVDKNTIFKKNVHASEMPKAPRCLPIMNVHKGHNRLSTLLTLPANKSCQTHLSCLTDIDKPVRKEEVPDATIIRTNNSSTADSQIQVDTINRCFDDPSQIRLEMNDPAEKESARSSTNDERIFQAIADRDGQRWSELVDQLITEQSNFSPSESARQLLDAIERLHTNQRLNSLTTGQLQRKVRYAMSKLKYIDERSSVRHNSSKTTKTNRSTTHSKRNTECSGKIDMSVTVRQIENRQPSMSTDQNWKPYVDRLFEQGHSAEEIRRLLREASERTMQSDDQRLQDVFLYINKQANQEEAKPAASGIAFVPPSGKINPLIKPPIQPKNISQAVKSNEISGHREVMTGSSSSLKDKKMVSDTVSLTFDNKDQNLKTGVTKDKSISPSMLSNNDSIKSSVVQSDVMQVKSLKNTSIPSFHQNQLETNTERKPRNEQINDATLESKDRPVLQSLTPSASERSISHHSEILSDHSTNVPLISPEISHIHALRQIQDNLEIMDRTDASLQPHLSNVRFALNESISVLEMNLPRSSSHRDENIELGIVQYVEMLNNEQKLIACYSEKTNFNNLNVQIFKILEILREYRAPAALMTTGNESFISNPHPSKMTTIPPESLVLLRQVSESTEEKKESSSQAVRLPFETAPDSRQHENTLSHQETVGLIRCRPIPYTSSNEKKSTETLKQALIRSTDDVNHVLKDLSVHQSDLSTDQSQTKWLDSLLSKISDNTDSTSHISSTTPSLAGVRGAPNHYNDEQRLSPNKSLKLSLSTHQQSTDALELTDDHQDTLHDTDLLKFEKEHAFPFVIPDQVLSTSDEQFQMTQTELFDRKSTSSPQPRSFSEDQLTSFRDEKSNASNAKSSSKSNLHSNETSQKSASTTALPANPFEKGAQTSTAASDSKSRSTVDQPLSSSNLDVSDQLDQFQAYEDNTTPEQLFTSSERTPSSKIVLTKNTTSSKTDTSTTSKRSAELLSSNEDKNRVLRTNQSDPTITRKQSASRTNTQALDEQASQAISKLLTEHNELHSFQLPEPTRYASLSDTVQSNSFLTHLNNQISRSNSKLEATAHSIRKEISIDTNKGTILKRNSSSETKPNGETDERTLSEIRLSATLPSSDSITQQSAKTVLSPSQITKSDNLEFKRLTTPVSFPLRPPSYSESIKSKEHTTIVQRDNVPNVLTAQPSGSVTPATNAGDEPVEVTHRPLFDETSHTSSLYRKEPALAKNTDDQESKADLETNRKSSQSKSITKHLPTPVTSSSYTSSPTIASDDDKRMKLKQHLAQESKSIREDSEYSNASSSIIPDQRIQTSNTSLDDNLKKSSSSRSVSKIASENTIVSDYSTHRSKTSDENPHINSSSELEQSRQKHIDRSKRNQPFKSDSLLQHRSSLSDKRLIANDPHQTKSTYGTELEEQHHTSTGVNSDSIRINSAPSSAAKKQGISSGSTAASQSSAINAKKLKRDQSPRPSPFEIKTKQLRPEDNQTLNKISSSSKRAKPIGLPTGDGQESEREKFIKKSGKAVADGGFGAPKSKRKYSSTKSVASTKVPSSLVAKLLPKRSSIKNISTTAQSTRVNTRSSTTDVSTSSNSTVATDHLLSTHSTLSDRGKDNRKSRLKNEFPSTSDSIFKRRSRKTPFQNQLFISSHPKERSPEQLTTKLIKSNLLANMEPIYDTEPELDADMKSQEDIAEFLIMNDRFRKKRQKVRITNKLSVKPFNSKAHGDQQANTMDLSKLPSLEQSCGTNQMKKWSNNPFGRRPVIRLPVTQIEKFECGTIGPRFHPSSIARQLSYLPVIHDHSSSPFRQSTPSLTDRLYSVMSPEKNDDKHAFEAILNWDQQQVLKTEQNKFHYMYLLDTSTKTSVRGRQYPILSDEIDMIDDPNTCTIMHEWAFADLVNAEREKYVKESADTMNIARKRSKLNKNIQICLRKRPLTSFEQNLFKEVDIISMVDSQTILLHIPSITVDNQVFIKNRKFKCDQTFNEHCQISTIYHSTVAPSIDRAIDGSKCLCLIGGGKYSGKTSLLRSLMDLLVFDLNRLLSTSDIYIKYLGICHNRIVDLLQNNSPIRIIKSSNGSLAPNDEFHLENADDIDYVSCQIKKRRRFIHQVIEINFREKEQSTIVGSIMIVMLASSQYVYTQKLCSHRRKFLINSLNKTVLAFRRALLGIRQSPNRIRAAFNNDILTRLIQPYVFDERSHVCYIGTLNPGHRHRVATKSTLDFARNLRFCLRRISRKRKKSAQRTAENGNIFEIK